MTEEQTTVDDREGKEVDAGTEAVLDYRFTLANERTFLAWMRTCLALMAAAVALIQFAPDLGSAAFRETSGLFFALLAMATAAGGLVRWLLVQRAMSAGHHLKRGALPTVVALGLAVVGLALAVVLSRALLG